MKVCFRCKMEIEEKDNYYEIKEHNNKKLISIDYVHRTCWDKFLEQLSSLKQAQSMLGRLDHRLTEMGILTPTTKEVIIK